MPQTDHRPSALKGVLRVIAAVFLFAVADTITKQLTMACSVALVVAGRYFVNLVILLAAYAPRHGRTLWQTNRTRLVLLRGLCLAAASLTMGFALRLMPLGETVTIIYLSPFAVMLLASPVLGERVPLVGWIGAAVAFGGILLIMRPGGHLDPVGVAFAIVNAALATTYHLLTRLLSKTETTMALLFHSAWIGLAAFLVILVFGGTGPLPDLPGWLLISALGALAASGHFLFTAAYRKAPASLLAPVNDLHLVWAGLLGWLVFAHIPDGPSLIGMALVTAAGVWVAIRAKRA